MAAQRKYFNSLKEARQAAEQRRQSVYKAGTKSRGKYWVGTELEWLNLY